MSPILPLLRSRLPSMTPAESRIASCILADPGTVVNETISHLAARAGTSIGSVANFSVSMGFRGFSDMKIRLAQSMETEARPSFDGVNAGDDPRLAMEKIIRAAEASFHDTLRTAGDSLDRAARLLVCARRIEIYAGGSSLPVGQDVHYRLMRMGLPAVIIPDPILAGISASQLGEGDLALAISHMGRTESTLAAVRAARQHGARVLGLTSCAESPLARISDVCLVSVSTEAAEGREAVVSRLTQLVIADSLCAYISAQRGTETIQFLDNEIEVLEQYRKKEQEV